MSGPAVVVGLGLRLEATPTDVSDAVTIALQACGADFDDVVALATVTSRMEHPAVVALAGHLGVECIGHEPHHLDAVEVPGRSEGVRSRTGTASVAEAAAILTAGTPTLLAPKRCTPLVCTAVARRAGPPLT